MKTSSENSKKVPPHRKAIQEASKIATGSQKPTSATNSTVNAHTSNNNKTLSSSIDSLTATTSGLSLDANDDYEASKVIKAKKSQHDADVLMVHDLDRWG